MSTYDELLKLHEERKTQYQEWTVQQRLYESKLQDSVTAYLNLYQEYKDSMFTCVTGMEDVVERITILTQQLSDSQNDIDKLCSAYEEITEELCRLYSKVIDTVSETIREELERK